MTDYKALCAELTDDLEAWVGGYLISDYPNEATVESFERIDRARAALAEPEPPDADEVAELVAWLCDEADEYDCIQQAPDVSHKLRLAADLLEHLAEPELQGELIPDRYSGYQKTVYRDGFHAGYKRGLTCARAALASEPEPVLEGPADDDIEALHQAVFASRLYGSPPSTTFEVDFARAVLARWGKS